MSSTEYTGTIRGKTIELDQNPGLPDGKCVTVAIQPVSHPPETPQEPLPTVETWCHRIVFDASVSESDKVVKGTNLLAESLVAELEQGMGDEELIQMHGELTSEDVAALRNYARVSPALRQLFGAWAADAEELDQFLEELRRQRKLSRRKIPE